MGVFLLIGSLLVMLAAALWIAVVGSGSESDVSLSGHGYAAMALGIVFSLVVGVGLMGLVFYSHRHGYDQPAERERQDNE